MSALFWREDRSVVYSGAMGASHLETTSSGPIREGTAAALLAEHATSRTTGLLEIYAAGRVVRLALRRGVPIHCSPVSTPWRLGEVLHHLGVPIAGDSATFRRALLNSSERSRSGERVATFGLVKKRDVDWALKEQLRLRAREVLSLRSGRYRLFNGSGALRGVPRLPNSWTAEALIEAIENDRSSFDDLRRLLRRLEESTDPNDALGLPRGAGSEHVRAAFRQLAKEHHPDHLQGVTDRMELRLHKRIFDAALDVYQRARFNSVGRHHAFKSGRTPVNR